MIHCRYCGKMHQPDVGCTFCSQLSVARDNIAARHCGDGLAHQNLVRLAAQIASAMHRALTLAACTRPTRDELIDATTWAVEEFLATSGKEVLSHDG